MHRGTVEKCIGHFENRFQRFSKTKSFGFDETIFDASIGFALAVDNIRLRPPNFEPTVIKNHPFFSEAFIEDYDVPNLRVSSNIPDNNKQTLMESRRRLLRNLPPLEPNTERDLAVREILFLNL